MIALYLVCAVVGVGLALIAALTGGHSHDVDAPLEAGHLDHELSQDGDHDGGTQVWLPFLSLRFWTYGLSGFGLTGLLLSLFSPVAAAMVTTWAVGIGVLCGLMIAIMVRVAMKSESDSSAHVRDMLGLDAEVIVAIRPGQPGKVRFTTKGETIDMLAISDDALAIEAGHPAIVVAIEGDKARVVSREAFYDEHLLARS